MKSQGSRLGPARRVDRRAQAVRDADSPRSPHQPIDHAGDEVTIET